MSIDVFEKRERALEIREKLLEAQLQKANGVPMLDFDEAIRKLKGLVHGRL